VEEVLGLCVRLDTELSLQRSRAPLVLAPSRPRLPHGHVEAHQHPVDGLLRRIDCQHALRTSDRPLGQTSGTLQVGKFRVGSDGQPAQPIPLLPEPILERVVTGPDTGQKCTLVQRAGLLQ
jgi:hypothetical protein